MEFFLIAVVGFIFLVIWLIVSATKIKMELKGSNDGFSFTDDVINIEFAIPKEGFKLHSYKDIAFTLSNKSNEAIHVEWDKCAFVDSSGFSLRVIHNGVKMNNRNESQPNTVVAPKTKIMDGVSPTDYIKWRDSTKNTSGGWEMKPIFADCEKKLPVTIRVFLSVRKNSGDSKIYDFEFKAEKVE